MEKRKPIAVAFSDIHLHEFKAFNKEGSRLNWSLKAFDEIFWKAVRLKVPILFCGDLFHQEEYLSNKVIERFTDTWKDNVVDCDVEGLDFPPFIAISGNHDMSESNTLDNKAPTYIRSFSDTLHNFTCIDNTILHMKGFTVAGVPYYKRGKEWVKKIEEMSNRIQDPSIPGKKVLLLHGDAPGAKNTTGHEMEKCAIPTNMANFFKDWDLVLFGHIHKPQQLFKRGWMLGSPIHQNSGDEGCEMGYWIVYDDMSVKFKHLENYPKFISVPESNLELAMEQLANEGRQNDYIIPIPEESEGDFEEKVTFTSKKPRKELSKAYCKEKGIEDKEKINLLTKILQEA